MTSSPTDRDSNTTETYRSRTEAIRVRTEACRFAAQVMQGCGEQYGLCPQLWSVAVFFESYIANGALHTKRDFGPKRAPKLKVATR